MKSFLKNVPNILKIQAYKELYLEFKMIILSLFDGCACARVALERASIEIEKYYASEIDKYAIQIAQKNWPDIIQLGDITKWQKWDIEKPDLIIGGSPCQGFSFAGKKLNFADPRSKLFFKYVDILNFYKPKYFLLENVKMKKESKNVISSLLKVEPIIINSSLVSAQNRVRLYWSNIKVKKGFFYDYTNFDLPEDKKLILKDILETRKIEEKYYCNDDLIKKHKGGNYLNGNYKSQANQLHNIKNKSNTICSGDHGYAIGYIEDKYFLSEKAVKYITNNERIKKAITKIDGEKALTLTAGYSNLTGSFISVSSSGKISKNKLGPITARYNKGVEGYGPSPFITNNQFKKFRRLTPLECERLQTLPDFYTEGVSDTQRYKMIGNGFTVDVIAHILKHIKE